MSKAELDQYECDWYQSALEIYEENFSECVGLDSLVAQRFEERRGEV